MNGPISAQIDASYGVKTEPAKLNPPVEKVQPFIRCLFILLFIKLYIIHDIAFNKPFNDPLSLRKVIKSPNLCGL